MFAHLILLGVSRARSRLISNGACPECAGDIPKRENSVGQFFRGKNGGTDIKFAIFASEQDVQRKDVLNGILLK